MRLGIRKNMVMALEKWQADFYRTLRREPQMELLFDRMADVVYSLKNREGRYVWFSLAGVERCGYKNRSEVIGKTAADVFPLHMAARYEKQDAHVFATGEPVHDSLDVTLYADRSPGWCLTHKVPLYDDQGTLVGLSCMSRDLVEPDRAGLIDQRFAAAVDIINHQYQEPLRVESLAEQAGFTPAQFERRMTRVFQLGPAQFIIKRRIAAAMNLLEKSDMALTDIAYSCGFPDQSAMTRQFKSTTGLTPGQYRKAMSERKYHMP